jgi:hypothetical protein
MSIRVTEHVIEGILVKVVSLPDGLHCSIIESIDVVFEATFNGEMKHVPIVPDGVAQVVGRERPAVPPTPEMLLVMKLAALEHVAHLEDDAD